MAMDLSKSLPVGSEVKLRSGTFVLTAIVVALLKKGVLAVKDLLGEGTEGIVNLLMISAWSTKGGDDKSAAKQDTTASYWLQDRIGKNVVVGLPGAKETVKGKLTEVFEDPALGACFVLQTSEGDETFNWANVLFVRLRVAAAKPAEGKPKAVAKKPADADTAELDFEVGPSSSGRTIIESDGEGDQLGLATETDPKQ